MARPIATTGQPGVPIATGGKPQTVKTVKVKAHTRTVAPKSKAPAKKPGPLSGLTPGQRSYWANKLPGASAKTILKARANQIQQHNPQAFGPNTNLSPIQANQQAGAAANLKFGPQISQLNQTIGNLPGWYQGYQNQIAQLQQQQNEAINGQQGLVAQINQSGAQVAGQQQQLQNDALKAMGQDAANRGATVDPNLAATSSQFQAGLSALNASRAQGAQQLGQSEQNYLTNLGQIQQAEGQRKLTNLKTQLAQVLSDKGDYTTQQKAQIVADAQKYGLELGALNLNNVKAKIGAQQGAAKLKLAGQIAGQNNANAKARIGATIRGQNINRAIRFGELNQQKQNQAATRQFKSDAQSLSRANFVAKYGITPEQAASGVKPTRGTPSTSKNNKITAGTRNEVTQVNNALGVIRNLMSQPKPNTHKIRTVLQLPKSKNNPFGGYDHDIINAAYDLFTFGHLSPANVKALKNLGVQIPKDWLH